MINFNTTTRSRRIRRPLIPRRVLMALVAVAAIAGFGGCEKYTDFNSFVVEPRPVVTSTDYRMAPPDVITIQSKRVREINGHTEQIRPDGKITLPLLGSVFVAGKTSEEVSADLQQRARDFYEDA